MPIRSYDPLRAPDPGEWLELPESESHRLVEEYHRRKRVRVPGPRLHAAFHVIVENQLAMGLPAVSRALERVMEDGVDRHEALHAVASVLAEHMHRLVKEAEAPDADPNEAYFADLEKLTLRSWREAYG